MLNISPSRIARYFYHECERYLLYEATPSEEKNKKNIPSSPYDHSPVTKAMLEAGYKWEEQVVEGLKKVYKADTQNGGRLFNHVHDEKSTIDILRNIGKEEYLYQGCLTVPESFYKTYNLDRSCVKFTTCFPDLIYATENGKVIELSVIDVKASDEMKISHKIQVALYALFLSHICKAHGIDRQVNFSKGGVWTYGLSEPEWFNINTVIPQIEEMLSSDIPRISRTDSVHWHIHYRCEWCEYYDFCRKEAEDSKSISLIPYLSSMGRKFLSDEEHIDDLISMKRFLSENRSKKSLSRCASLSGKQDRLARMVDALMDGQIDNFGSSSVSMPVWEDIKLLLTIQKEPVSGQIYSAAFLRNGSDDIFKPDSIPEKQFVASSMEDCKRIRREFIECIYDIFKEVHDYNETKNESKEQWKEKKSLQTYVFDSFEWELLKELLLEGLKDPLVSEKSLALFFHFHSENLLVNEEHPDVEASFPAVKIIDVIRSLFALPVPVAYQLSDVLDVFNSVTGKNFTYNPMDNFTFRLSNALKSDAIYKVWNNDDAKRIEWIEKELKKRLYATSYILTGIRHCAKGLLFAYPPKFSLPSSRNFNHPLLSQLDFIIRYETVMSYLSVKEQRTLPMNERKQKGLAFTLTATGNVEVFKGYTEAEFSLKETDAAGKLDGDNIWSYILSEDTPEGDKDQMSFTEYPRYKYYAPKNKALYLAQIKDNSHPGRVTLQLKKGAMSPPVEEGKDYLLQSKFTDWTGEKVISRLAQLDGMEEPEAIKLLQNPVEYCKDIEEKDDLKEAQGKIPSLKYLTDSQRDAFDHVFNKTLTLLWGPPGTGKTHFIAAALLCILEAHRLTDRPFKIFLSAFTHTAISNCLKKIVQLNDSLNIWKEEFALAKLGRSNEEKSGILEVKSEEGFDYICNNSRCILGGTVYSTNKMFTEADEDTPFDMVVIDEGSQLRVPESLLAISRLKAGGRLLIAGDDRQLPPIIKGYYPDPAPGEPLLHRSIFEALKNPDIDKTLTCQLFENFRMNKTLCLYPAEKIYGEKYKSFNAAVETKKLLLTDNLYDNPFIETVLEPDYSLVLCITEGIRTGSENREEAELVAQIALALRERLIMKDTGKPYPDDREGDRLFWKEGLFIVSPHHVQIDAICEALENRGLTEPFVGTVDKMQGQECDSVIVSYGVSDPELAISEDEFIYSLNRLNVSITRAKCKTIVFLSRYLLKPTLQVLAKRETEEGISFMTGLERFAAKGKESVFQPFSAKEARLIVYSI
ncbi:MAG: AAA domain-containing protein [Candidatus Eremiobacterota bacterium]